MTIDELAKLMKERPELFDYADIPVETEGCRKIIASHAVTFAKIRSVVRSTPK